MATAFSICQFTSYAHWYQPPISRRTNRPTFVRWPRIARPVEEYLDYIHLNPARARIVSASREESLLDCRWRSLAGVYAKPPRKRPGWMAWQRTSAAGRFDSWTQPIARA